jgi:hypothetical protein
MTELIQTKSELIDYLTTKRIASKEPPKSVNVTTSIRKLIMTDEMQGEFIHNGRSKRFEFKNLGGGVWSASIAD